jgi:small subunit ribosomal protein S9
VVGEPAEGNTELAGNNLQYYGTGRRKRAVARVYVRPGTGKITVNDRALDAYFPSDTAKMIIKQPLVITETADKLDLLVKVQGGGPSGQAGALRHGLARALVEYNPDLRARLKEAGFLTRDARRVERKKYGRPGARKRFQYSKR